MFVGGGSVANMLAVWRVHALDVALRAAWEVVLGGTSAGAICWFEAGLTDSFGPQLRTWSDGLGFLPGSFCPHHDRDPRRERYLEEVAGQRLPAGLACGGGGDHRNERMYGSQSDGLLRQGNGDDLAGERCA